MRRAHKTTSGRREQSQLGEIGTTKALLKAALRVWELKPENGGPWAASPWLRKVRR